MPKKSKLTPTRRIGIWPYRDPNSGAITFTVVGPFCHGDWKSKKITISELRELRDAAAEQIELAREAME